MESIDKINQILAQRGMSGAALSKMIGLSTGTYSTWNTGSRKISKINLHKIASALDVPYEELLPDQVEQELTPAHTSGEEQTVAAAFFGGDDDLTPEENAELFRDALEYYNFKRQQLKERKRKKE